MTSQTNVTNRNVKVKQEKKKIADKIIDKADEEKPSFKYGPLPRFAGQRVWTRGVLIIGIMIYIWYFSKSSNETTLCKQKEMYNRRGQVVDCSLDYINNMKEYIGCVPLKCGRYVSDKIITVNEANALLNLAQRVMALGGSSGGATVMDLNSGALSFNDKFVNAFLLKDHKWLTPADKTILKLVKSKIQETVAGFFGISSDAIHLTYPLFFSRLTNRDPIIPNDEYWHGHIDKTTYESFHYTALLYLNDYGIDFKGGRFIFMSDIEKSTKNTTVEPRKGRVLMFTSGAENPHFVERVTEGQRFAMTIPFSCDPTKAFKNPELQ